MKFSKKILVIILVFICFTVSGCTSLISSEESAPTPTDLQPNHTSQAAACPVGGDSRINDKRYVTNGSDLYYTREDPQGLRMISAPFSEEIVLWPSGYNWVCLVGHDIYLWSYVNELYKIDAVGNTDKLMQEEDSVNGMWYYEGSLYYLVQDDYAMNTIKSFDLATNKTQTYDESVSGMYPDFAVVAGYIFYTTAGPDFDEFDPNYRLVRIPIGNGIPTTMAEKVLSFSVSDGMLYYLACDENGKSELISLNPTSGETIRVHSGVYLPFCIDGDDIYYSLPTQKGAQLVRATMNSEGEAVLFDGHFASNDVVIFGDNIYFDEWNGVQMNYYIGAKDGSQLKNRDDVFPYAVPDKPVEAPKGTSTLYLKSGDELISCFKLYDADGNLIWTELLKPGESKTVSFDSGKYYLKIGEGEKWISDDEAFGSDGNYSSTGLYNFLPGQSYTIGSGTTGDFHAESQSEFTGN